MPLTQSDLEAIEKILVPRFDRIDTRLDRIEQRLDIVESHLKEIRYDLGYENLKVVKRKSDEDLEEM